MEGGIFAPSRLRLAFAFLLIALALTAAPSAGAASLTCPEQQTSRPFLPWADVLSYAHAPGGNFEAGATGWRLSGGAGVAPGNETFYVGSASDRSSLALPVGSSATSPTMCVNVLDPVMRFFVVNAGGDGSVKVEVIYKTLLGLTATHEVGLLPVTGSPSWQPTLPLLFFADVTGILSVNGLTTDVKFRFTARGTTSKIRIDDVYVDPLYIP